MSTKNQQLKRKQTTNFFPHSFSSTRQILPQKIQRQKPPVNAKIQSNQIVYGGNFMPQSTLLTDEDRNLLAKVSNLEQLTETISILEDKKAMADLKQAKKEAKEGKLRDYKEFFTELKEADEI